MKTDHGHPDGTVDCLSVCSYGSAAQALQTQLVGQLAGCHGVGKILFVGEDQNDSVLQLVLLDLRTESCDE